MSSEAIAIEKPVRIVLDVTLPCAIIIRSKPPGAEHHNCLYRIASEDYDDPPKVGFEDSIIAGKIETTGEVEAHLGWRPGDRLWFCADPHVKTEADWQHTNETMESKHWVLAFRVVGFKDADETTQLDNHIAWCKQSECKPS